jgi:hypothetical protein
MHEKVTMTLWGSGSVYNQQAFGVENIVMTSTFSGMA